MMRRSVAHLIWAILTISPAGALWIVGTGCANFRAKASVPSPPAFKTASVKPHDPRDTTTKYSYTSFSVAQHVFQAQAPLVQIIGAAYRVPSPGLTNALILGGPAWVRDDAQRYDVSALSLRRAAARQMSRAGI
jgi:hypothetical protein